MTGLQTLRREVAAVRRLSARLRVYCRLIPILLALFINAPVESKEAVIFEQIGQLAGVTAYLHVHIELSITSVEQQLDKYRQLLVTKLGTEDSIRHFMLSQVPGMTSPNRVRLTPTLLRGHRRPERLLLTQSEEPF